MIAIYRQRVGGCSPVGKIAQQEYGISRCEISPARFTLANQSSCKITSLISTANLPSKRACYMCLPPSKSARDGGGGPVRRHTHLELAGLKNISVYLLPPYFFLWILISNYVAEWSIWANNPWPQSLDTTCGYRSQRSPHGSSQQQGVKNISKICV